MKKNYYDEILPHLSLTTVRLSLECEDIYGSIYGWLDYGLDLNRLVEREKGLHMKHFVFNTVDVKKTNTQEVKNKYKDLMKKKKPKKYELVNEKFVGKDIRGY